MPSSDTWASLSMPFELYEQIIKSENRRRKKVNNPTEELKKEAEKLGMTVEQLLCPSTHGHAGYSPETSWNDEGNLVCGLCEFEIVDPPPTGGKTVSRRKGWKGWFRYEHRSQPDWGWLGTNKKAIKRYYDKYPEKAEWK